MVEGDGAWRARPQAGHGVRRPADPAEPGLQPAQLLSSAKWPRAARAAATRRAARRSRAARARRNILAHLVDVVRLSAPASIAPRWRRTGARARQREPARRPDAVPATITDPATFPNPNNLQNAHQSSITNSRFDPLRHFARAATAGTSRQQDTETPSTGSFMSRRIAYLRCHRRHSPPAPLRRPPTANASTTAAGCPR